MKVAILVSGQIRGNYKRNIRRLSKAFRGADVFTATWDNEGRDDDVDYVFPVPELKYHPIVDIDEGPYPVGWHRRVYNWTDLDQQISEEFFSKNAEHHQRLIDRSDPAKATSHLQLLIHDKLLQKVDPDNKYDIIIRARFDTVISLAINWEEYVKESYYHNTALGFGKSCDTWRFINKTFRLGHTFPHPYECTELPTWDQYWAYFLFDPLIIHTRRLWSHERVDKLFKRKQLRGCEQGWYQILAQNRNIHENFYGGVCIERYLHHVEGYKFGWF